MTVTMHETVPESVAARAHPEPPRTIDRLLDLSETSKRLDPGDSLAVRLPAGAASLARPVFHRFLSGIEGGSIDVNDGRHSRRVVGRTDDRNGRATLHARLDVLDPRVYSAVVAGGSSGLGEAYRRGWFDTDDLTSLLRLLARAYRRMEPARRSMQRVTGPFTEPIRRWHRPDAGRDRAHIAAHYDLGNEFFELFLDETLTYSSGWFEHPDVSMADASLAKIDRLCRALDLRPGQRVVEIGTGWGTFAIHAATAYGVDVVTTTLSAEQHAVAMQRVAEAGVADRVDVRLDHYRELRGTYDAVVAVEMIEAVDWREVGDFLAHCEGLLAPTGALGLQAIVTAPARHRLARNANDFIKSHVFPGSSIPSVPTILDTAARRTDLSAVDLSDLGMHYAETLRRWRHELATHRGEAKALGLDEAFLRLWDFYLSYCEAGFEERQVSVVQLVLERPGRATPIEGTRVHRPS